MRLLRYLVCLVVLLLRSHLNPDSQVETALRAWEHLERQGEHPETTVHLQALSAARHAQRLREAGQVRH